MKRREAPVESYDLLDEEQRRVHERFPKGHWLSNPEHVYHFILWCTFYERNLHRFVTDYFKLKLHPYQKVLLYMMGRSRIICAITCRAGAKSWIVGVYSCAIASLKPGSKIAIGSGVKGQGKLIVTKKIIGELLRKSPNGNLAREINEKGIKTSQEVQVPFYDGSDISAYIVNDNTRGIRSTIAVGEEARQIDKGKWDEIFSPTKIVRELPFLMLPAYAHMVSEFVEEPQTVFISSSVDERHWLYQEALRDATLMMNGEDVFFCALDYSITLRHGLRTRAQMIEARDSTDPITWAIEYENRVFREGTNAFFPYDLVRGVQTLRQVFYPRTSEGASTRTRNKYAIPKQPGEVRVVACDIAMIDRKNNDNSCTSCMRLLPENESTGSLNNLWEEPVVKDYRIQIPYIEAWRGTQTESQAIRIRQLYEDFQADFIVLDMRNAGIAVLDSLAKPLYDPDRGIEYEPLNCMNDPEIAARYGSRGRKVIFCISASLRLNSEMAVGLKVRMLNKTIELLGNVEDAEEDIRRNYPEYLMENDPDKQLFFEKPYRETQLAVNEMVSLEYEKMENTGLIKVREKSTMTKDRYSSIAMGCYFADQLKKDVADYDDTPIGWTEICVTKLNF